MQPKIKVHVIGQGAQKTTQPELKVLTQHQISQEVSVALVIQADITDGNDDPATNMLLKLPTSTIIVH